MSWSSLGFEDDFRLIFLVVVALGIVYIGIQASNPRKRYKNLICGVLRVFTFCFLIAALSKPYHERPGSQSLLPIYVDISDSIDESLGQASLDRALRIAAVDGSSRVMPFSADTNSPQMMSDKISFTNLKDSNSQLNIGSSNLEEALRNAIKNGDRNLLFVSDGQETAGSIDAVLTSLKRNGIAVYPILPDQIAPGERNIRITDIQAPLIAKKQNSIEVGVSIRNSLPERTTGKLVVTVDGEEVYNEEELFGANEELRKLVQINAIGEGVKEVVAQFVPDAKQYASSSARTFISGEQREKVLLLSGQPEDGQHIEQALKDQQFQLVHQFAGSIDSATLQNINDFSVIILNNIPISALPKSLPLEIKKFVSSGGGFVMIGGNNSFGLGGYKDTSIGDILPVHLIPPQKDKKRLNIAVQLVLDKSGSMKDNSKIIYSKMAAVQVVDSLKPDDYLGIIGFDSTPFELLPIAPVGVNREKAKKRVELMFPGTTTKLLPALDLGRRRLELAKAGRKHMIILTDGKIPDGPARRPHYLGLVDEMRRTGITVSTFMIGSEQDFILKEMSVVGGGAFYRTRDITNLPRLFLDDIKVSTGEKTQKEAERFDVRKGDGEIVSTDLTSFPVVRGYVKTKRRSDANLELVAYANRKADPLLASWKYNQGRSLAYTSDVSGRWSYYWVSWPRFYSFWNDIIESARGESADSDSIQFEMSHHVKGKSLFIETSVFSAALPGSLKIKLESAGGESSFHPMTSLALGHYQTRVDDIQAGTYTATLMTGDKELTPAVFSLSGELFGEKKGQGYNVAALTRLAKQTGGIVNPSKQLLENVMKPDTVKNDLSKLALVLALILFLTEIFIRESRFRLKLKP